MPEPEKDADYTFDGTPEGYPDDWIESGPSGLRLRSNRRHAAARELTVDAAGTIRSSGRRAWFLPGKFKFCSACRHQPAGQAREVKKLAALSAEGRVRKNDG